MFSQSGGGGGGLLKGSPRLLPIISRKLSPFLHQILVNM